jgi:hypothetical protein
MSATPPQAPSVPVQPRAVGDKSTLAAASRSVVFRAVNEQIRQIAESFAVNGELELICECDRGNCFARLSVSPLEYEAVRRFPTRFLAKREHVGADERIVEETDGYVVVEKIGPAVEPAIRLDPRRQTDRQATR